MASLIYNSCIDDLARGAIDFDTDTFYLMLVSSAYVPDKDAHDKRNHVTNEVAASGSYAAGGAATAVTITKDTVNDRVDISFGGVSFTSTTITARAGVIYKRRGGTATQDELIAYVDFGGDISSTGGNFAVVFNSPLRFQN